MAPDLSSRRQMISPVSNGSEIFRHIMSTRSEEERSHGHQGVQYAFTILGNWINIMYYKTNKEVILFRFRFSHECHRRQDLEGLSCSASRSASALTSHVNALKKELSAVMRASLNV